ncbi:nitroreductase [Lachnospiraceae bacterium KGMB03038]|nr:nitroreductase [Lachnospiraceae bacterium KGMB03038]
MEIMEAMKQRHSVRQYTDQRIEKEAAEKLQREIDACNKESGLHIQLVTDEPKAFDGFMAHYGKFSGVKNYIALIGKKGPKLEETCGYYGERLVLLAQRLGMNSCWAAMTYSKIKGAYEVKAGEKLCCVISIGYGVNQGVSHKVKKVEELCQVNGQMPQWFRAGVEAAQLAPTAMNQQKFYFVLKEDQVAAKTKAGFYTKVDLGIAKYHFEIGAGVGNDWKWAQ